MSSPYSPTGETPVPPSDDWQVPVGPAFLTVDAGPTVR